MTFAVETADDWLVFLSAARIFVSATKGYTWWFNRLNAVDNVDSVMNYNKQSKLYCGDIYIYIYIYL